MYGRGQELFIQNSLGVEVEKYVVSAFAAVAWYNAIELVVLCLLTFKRYRGYYFWSLLITSSNLVPYCLSDMLLFYQWGISSYISVTLCFITSCCVLTGHSLVLWSRLHLVLQSPKLLQILFRIIIIDTIVFLVPTAVLNYIVISLDSRRLGTAYNIMTLAQLIAFCIQESLISIIYIWETTKLLRLRSKHSYIHILVQLLVMNIAIVLLDMAIIGIQLAGYYTFQAMFRHVTYSIKLKLEYFVLNQLIQIAKEPISFSDSVTPSVRGNTTAAPQVGAPAPALTGALIASRPSKGDYV
ncbi:uncharacterized protein BDW43DRAFT_302007 [Aspergillus alliaceus]|uniref:uncharacterized protein n=1 Tax=Petromyces alliaceus TaxID=209559 RepID=UPI0012A586A3|nr:uncharacterized protein BDW43DRAFT_302007 [Aspergillus alliaceus]KAB8231132.1 hypothetical protein BDW43DRAFT_302007 [Aspergillus alliaceus]